MSIVKNVAHIVFSLYCWVGTYAWMITTSFLCVPVLGLLGQKRAHRLTLFPALGWCVPMCFIRTRIHRHPEFDATTNGMFIQNHISVLDGSLATYVIPHSFCGLFNSWHFWLPGYGWIIKLSHGIGVPSKREGRSEELSRAVRNRVDEIGISVLAFPEGHRTIDGNVRPFRRGVFFMARDAGVPVIPLCVRGLYELQNKTHRRFSPGSIDVYLGKPIPTAGLTDEQIGELAEYCQAMHQSWLETGEMPQLEEYPEPPQAKLAA